VPTFLLLSVTITLLTFIGDGVRNAFDPRKN
jgi:ABC-type microcin C transport system permease subunit YejE